VTAIYPPLDADHVAQWDLDEQLADLLYTTDPDHIPPQWGRYAPFVDAVAGNNLTLHDAFPTDTAAKFYEIGAPGPFGGSVIFKGGSSTDERDYLYGSSVPEPTTGLSIDGWYRAFGVSSPANVIQKEYNPATWPTEPVSAQLYQLVSTGEWGACVNIGGTRVYTDAIGHGTQYQHLRLIFGVWNHFGLTHDGSYLCAYINGVLAGRSAAAGAIDWGAHGLWVLGGSRPIGSAGADAANGNIGRMRISKVARPLSYFFNSYQGAVVGVSGVVGSGDLVLAPPPITIVGRGPGGLGMRLD
jgi:hypothetical protein